MPTRSPDQESIHNDTLKLSIWPNDPNRSLSSNSHEFESSLFAKSQAWDKPEKANNGNRFFKFKRAGSYGELCCCSNYNSCIVGLVIGLLLGGICLATILTMWLTTSKSAEHVAQQQQQQPALQQQRQPALQQQRRPARQQQRQPARQQQRRPPALQQQQLQPALLQRTHLQLQQLAQRLAQAEINHTSIFQSQFGLVKIYVLWQDVWHALSVLYMSFSENPHLISTHLHSYCEKNGSHNLACSLTETLLDFDAGGSLPVNYGNFTWTGANILDGATYNPMSGYHVVVCSGAYIIFTSGTIKMQKIPTGATFTLNSFLATAAWYDNLNLTISGQLSSTVIYSANFILQVFSITVVNLNWSGIDTMTLTTSGGTKNINVTGSGKHVAIDNMCVTY
ncbi:unnamed protein product [Rotaria magnacalcarata]|uniref:Uncharacterized protein n=1 Tax=Rotaria magnacalcarata TaxID=392030 RepID=A0A819FMW4_9BILA|nr:unnamed protein product [Rotaria magnacalcarata]